MRRPGASNRNRSPELAHVDAPTTEKQRNPAHLSRRLSKLIRKIY
jgi:hypothetical protein